MAEPYDPTRPTLERLMEAADRSAEDLAAGRLVPVEEVLADLRERAARGSKSPTLTGDDALPVD